MDYAIGLCNWTMLFDQTGLHILCPCYVPLPVAQGNTLPDTVVISNTKLTLAVLQDMMDNHLEEAQTDLKNKLEGGLFGPAYQEIPGIIVAAVAGTKLQFGFCSIHGVVRD